MNRKFWFGLLIGFMSSVVFLAALGTASASSRTASPIRIAGSAQLPITSTVKTNNSVEAPQRPDGGGGPGPLPTGFTYQGSLSLAGILYTGSCDMQFRLYDAYTGGTLLGASAELPSPVSVYSGTFTTYVDFGNQFTGDLRDLEIDVRCPSGAGITQTLAPRQVLYGTPYALGLRPGTIISGSTWPALTVRTTAADGNGIEAYANAGTNGWGVYASASGIGVYGNSDHGYGVKGASLPGPLGGTGVYGSGSTGVYGNGTSYGVHGNSLVGIYGESSSDSGYGVYGYNSSNNGPGVYGQGSLGIGVKGTGTYTGVYGLANASNSSVTYGVYGRAYSINGYGTYGYSLGGTGAADVSNGGIGVYASSASGNPIEAYVGSNRVFYVANSGNVYADGSYNCGLGACLNTGVGADVAERINATDSMEPGDLVEIDPNQPDQFRLARTAYSTLVAGVVSTNPGVTMNNNDLANNDTGQRTDQRPLLALVGKIPVKVSAENGPIHIGDLLVASSTPGHAMRAGSNPAMGTVIGKALGSLDKGTGTILMLVMLR